MELLYPKVSGQVYKSGNDGYIWKAFVSVATPKNSTEELINKIKEVVSKFPIVSDRVFSERIEALEDLRKTAPILKNQVINALAYSFETDCP